LSALDRKLAEIDDVAASIKALTSPASQPSGSAANGTGGGGGGSSSSSSSSSSALDVAALDAANAKTKSMLAELQASKEKLAAQLAEVEKHKAAAAEAAAAVAQRNKDLQEAQEKKQKQGEIVDNTVHVARKAMVEQAKIYQEEDKLRAEMFLSLKVAVLSAGLSAID
jgi:cysteinyl-tRNA synthetase